MAKPNPKFKAGDWLLHKVTGNFLRIDIIITWPGIHKVFYATTWVYGDDSFPIQIEGVQDEANLLEYFDLAPSAEVLFG